MRINVRRAAILATVFKVARALPATDHFTSKEPQGLCGCRSDGKLPTGSLCYFGRLQNLLFETSQLSVHWQTLMLPQLPENWQHPKRLTSIQA